LFGSEVDAVNVTVESHQSLTVAAPPPAGGTAHAIPMFHWADVPDGITTLAGKLAPNSMSVGMATIWSERAGGVGPTGLPMESYSE